MDVDATIPRLLGGLVTPGMYQLVPTEGLLRDLGPRLDPTRSSDTLMTLGLSFPDREEEHGLIVRRGVIQYLPDRPGQADVRVQLNRTVLDEVISGRASWDDAVASGRVKIEGDPDQFKRLVGLFDF